MRAAFGILLLAILAGCVRPPEPARHIGEVEFDVSCTDDGQRRFEEGLALLHHAMYTEAGRVFLALTAIDPDCAMAHWGIAMTGLRPLRPDGPDEAALGEATAELALARSFDNTNEREKAYVEATAAYFRDAAGADHAARLVRWAEAQTALHTQYPDDLNAAAFHALALLAVQSDRDSSYRQHQEAREILEPLFASDPEHPGVDHVLIHAYDCPQLADRAGAVLRAYDKISADLTHPLHLPSHIFVRQGDWRDVIRSNVRAASAARRVRVAGGTSSDHPHAMDYLMYGYLQAGWDQRAEGTLRQLEKITSFENNFLSAYGLAAAPARFYLEQRDWEGASRLPRDRPESFPWHAYPAARAVTHFARGVGAARSGKAEAARESVLELERLEAELVADAPYWSALVGARRQAVEAWVVLADGDADAALFQMRAAADIEDGMNRNTVVPGPVLPLRELLGDMFLELGRPAEALPEFEASLARAPDRLYSLYWAGRAAQRADDVATARSYYTTLVRNTEASRSERSEVLKAKYFLRLHPAEKPEG